MNPRWKIVQTKLEGKDATEYNQEEILILTSVIQLEAQETSREQGQAMLDLSKQMAATASKSAEMAKELAKWTMLLAVATFTLAVIALLGILIKR
jgi:hypothetical protein